MHYCHTLTNQFDCTLITVLHKDIYSSEDVFSLPLQMEYLADITIKTEPLITGLAADVHGQVLLYSLCFECIEEQYPPLFLPTKKINLCFSCFNELTNI
nr:elongator complex protein 6 [Tanacetum cinerariifolium]